MKIVAQINESELANLGCTEAELREAIYERIAIYGVELPSGTSCLGRPVFHRKKTKTVSDDIVIEVIRQPEAKVA